MTCSLLIVVGGDLARSPRMLRHAEAALLSGMSVELAGFRGASLPASVSAARISTVPALELLRARSGVAAALVAGARQLLLTLSLTVRLVSARQADFVLIQTPPLLPVAPLVWLFARMRGARLAIDWHNSAEAMTAQRFGKGMISGLVRRMERLFARSRNISHLSVSSALSANLGLQAIVIRDSPPSRFQPASRRKHDGRGSGFGSADHRAEQLVGR